jgi:stalled ribosome rescue protein Dom34
MGAEFMEKIAAAMGDAAEILLVGPGEAKMGLKTYLERRHPHLAGRILGIEAMDKASAGEIAAAARKYFYSADRIKLPTP